ncbi:Rho termination factor, N-terminal [Parasponia andersonii]|uniref:Rho termination factor, N-terminal n=1 Tax=Parasponia andersonii TaxID=3476 RepID=A0A2P5AX76_PARAD|nr:Rho termination factor, N-terminal [Parasponia andersonii]
MGAIVAQAHSIRFSTLNSSFTNQPKLGKSIFCLKDVALPFKRKDLRFGISCIGSDGNRRGRPPRRNSISGSETNEEEINKSPVSRKQSSPNQEEIIALFRRIQSSISNKESTNHNKTTSNASATEDNPSSAESLLRVLSGSGKKQGKAKNEDGSKILRRRRGVPKKEEGIQDDPPATNSRLTRPPSKFVKRSPILSPVTPRGKFLELDNETETSLKADGSELDLPRVDEMKLPELKELAKSRGIKGYSRMKKSELISLLGS